MINFDCSLARPSFNFDVAFQAKDGITALFGPSGSGKSTAIRLLAGLERPDRGRITAGDTVLLDTARRLRVASHRRRIGLVFQDARLFPHLSVKANLGYGRWFAPKVERQIGFEPVIDILGIAHLLHRRPATLSGGERQRVAIGRAMLASPRMLLMDEPLAALDGNRKQEILPFIERLRDEFAIPIVYVSHSTEEVARLASRVVKLENGRVTRIGSATEILALSSVAPAADRFGIMSLLNGKIGRYLPDYNVTIINHPAGEIVVPGHVDPLTEDVQIGIPATNVTIAVGNPGNLSIRTALSGRVVKLATDHGPFAMATVLLRGGDLLTACATRLGAEGLALKEGDEVIAMIKSVSINSVRNPDSK